MKFDVVIAGIGGQGVLTAATFISRMALASGLQVKQSEVHGMAQRGGTVVAQVRIADAIVESSLIRYAGAGLIIGFEPLEALRVLHLLSPDGWIVTTTDQVRNFSDYPQDTLLDSYFSRLPHCFRFNGRDKARNSGIENASSMIVLGAASRHIPFFDGGDSDRVIGELFKGKGDFVVDMNRTAFRLGRELQQ